MNIAEQMISVIQSAGIPILAVMTGLAVLSTMKVPGKVTGEDEENFTMRESNYWLLITVYCVVAGAIFVWLGLTKTNESVKATDFVWVIVCACGCLFTLYMYFKRKMIVSGENLTYCPAFGKKETFDVKTFSKMEAVQTDRCEELKVYNKTGQMLFKVQGYMTNSSLLKKYMRNHRVRVVKINLEGK